MEDQLQALQLHDSLTQQIRNEELHNEDVGACEVRGSEFPASVVASELFSGIRESGHKWHSSTSKPVRAVLSVHALDPCAFYGLTSLMHTQQGVSSTIAHSGSVLWCQGLRVGRVSSCCGDCTAVRTSQAVALLLTTGALHPLGSGLCVQCRAVNLTQPKRLMT